MTYPSAGTFPNDGGGGGTVLARSVINVPYLGRPGVMMQLPSPNGPISATPSFGDTTRTLANGAAAVNRRLYEKKQFSLPYIGLGESEAGIILGFYRRIFGSGPFVFVDPSVTNVLPLDVSTCGVRSQAPHGWSTSAGALTRTGLPPAQAPQSGVLRWVPAANATLTACTTAGAVQTLAAPVYLTQEAVTVSLYATAAAASTFTLILLGYTAAGVVASNVLTASMAVTTSWTRFTVTAPLATAGLSSTAFMVPQIVAGTTVPSSMSIAAAQLEYADSASAWQVGAGSPRVLPAATPGRDVQQADGFPTDHTFTLTEAV